MAHQFQIAPANVELLGDARPLIERIGSMNGFGALADAIVDSTAGRITTLAELRLRLEAYHATILKPFELPAIQRAFLHAQRNELREILALDRQLAGEPALQPLSSASRMAGRAQLQRLAPLRDDRLVQRYLAAIGKDEVNGWHTLVYGLTLAVYSVPLRQGMIGYTVQTTRGFIDAATRSLALPETDWDALCAELCFHVPATVDLLLGPGVLA